MVRDYAGKAQGLIFANMLHYIVAYKYLLNLPFVACSLQHLFKCSALIHQLARSMF